MIKIVSEGIVEHDIPDNIKLSGKLKKFAELVKDCKVGESKSYLSDYFGQEELDNLETGHSAVIASDVGTGKSTAIINTAFAMHSKNIYILVNRRYCIIQLKREYMKLIGIAVSDWCDDAVIGYDTGNIKFMTYQKLAQKGSFYKLPENSIVVLDEIHYLLNDAVFSYEPEIIKNIIHANKKRTKRVYISATIDEVLDEIIMLESKCDEPARIDEIFMNNVRYKINNTLIDQIYLIPNSYEHINLKFYNYSDIDTLADYLNANSENGGKSLVFVRNKNRGEALKEKLTDSEMVFATENGMPILSEISGNAEYFCSSLLATKVLENGVSIVDSKVGTIVIDEIDSVTFRQFLGRVRNSRVNPRPLTVIIPDYTLSELIQYSRQCYQKINTINYVIKNTDYCMSNFQEYSPYVYYDRDDKIPNVNYLALQKLTNLNNYVKELIDEEMTSSHAYIRNIQRLLFLPETIEDKQFLNYNDLAKFKSAVQTAYNEFASSPKLKADRDKLAKDLIKVVSETSIYPKKITGNQIQIDKINDILDCAGISAKIQSLGETFGLIE